MPTQKSAWKWHCDLSHERLQRAFTRANQLHWTAASLEEVLDNFLSTNGVWLVICKMIGTVLSLQMVWGWFFPRAEEVLDSFLSTNGVWLVLCKMIGTILSLQMVWGWFFEEVLDSFLSTNGVTVLFLQKV